MDDRYYYDRFCPRAEGESVLDWECRCLDERAAELRAHDPLSDPDAEEPDTMPASS